MGRRQSVYILFRSSHRPVFLVNSRQHHFSAAPISLSRKGLHQQGHPLSRSYRVNLPSSLTTVLSSALGYSPHPPVSVLVRTPDHFLEVFLGGQSNDFAHSSSTSLLGFRMRIYLHAALKLVRTNLTVRSPFLPRHPIGITRTGGTGILTCCPSATPFSLALGSD